MRGRPTKRPLLSNARNRRDFTCAVEKSCWNRRASTGLYVLLKGRPSGLHVRSVGTLRAFSIYPVDPSSGPVVVGRNLSNCGKPGTAPLRRGNQRYSGPMRHAPSVLGAILVAVSLFGQDVVSPNDVARADLIIVGTLNSSFRFPWLDGWNERGNIVVKEVVKGPAKTGDALPFGWERDYGAGGCLTKPDSRGAVGQRGVWLLSKPSGQSRYRSPDLFVGFRPLVDLPLIKQMLATAQQRQLVPLRSLP